MAEHRGTRNRIIFWTGCCAGSLLVAGMLIAIIWPLSDFMATHDVRTVPAKTAVEEWRRALDADRGLFLQIGAGLLAFGAFIYTSKNFVLARQAHELTEQGQVTERFTKAIDHLGSDKADVRIGGIYALERIARDSVRDHGVIMEVLCAFIRRKGIQGEEARYDWPPADVGAALTVIARRKASADRGPIDLRDADLRNVVLPEVQLSNAMLRGTLLDGADLRNANLNNAMLDGAHLADARLDGANLDNAHLANATLTEAHLDEAHLANAMLTGAHLKGAHLAKATLSGAHLDKADLTGTDLAGALMTDTVLAGTDLSDADLCDATLSRSDFRGAILSSARLSRAALGGANFNGAGLADASLDGAQLIDVTFIDANLSGTKFSRANLTGVNLSTLKLAGLDLTGAWIPPDAATLPGWEVETEDSGMGVLRRTSLGG